MDDFDTLKAEYDKQCLQVKELQKKVANLEAVNRHLHEVYDYEIETRRQVCIERDHYRDVLVLIVRDEPTGATCYHMAVDALESVPSNPPLPPIKPPKRGNA